MAETQKVAVVTGAGTGIGKTLGYLAPASLWAEQADGAVWVSTFIPASALREQLIGGGGSIITVPILVYVLGVGAESTGKRAERPSGKKSLFAIVR